MDTTELAMNGVEAMQSKGVLGSEASTYTVAQTHFPFVKEEALELKGQQTD